MKDMGSEFKLTIRTLWDVNDVLNEVEARAARDRHAWMVHRADGGKKKPTRAAVVSALVLYLDSRPKEEQEAILRDGMARLNAALSGTPEAPAEAARAFPGLDREAAPAEPARPLFAGSQPEAAPKKTRRA